MRETQRLRFYGRDGQDLVGILDRPTENMKFQAIFAHCFTCTKDLKAAVKISRALVEFGIGVFRFDFTGLGESGGDFSRSTFEGNCDDLNAAIEFVGTLGPAPTLLIGHSLGGAASLATACYTDTIRGVCSLAAPSDTPHLEAKLRAMNPELASRGEGKVTIGGSDFMIREPLLASLREFSLESRVRSLNKPVLLVHSPTDQTLEIEHAYRLREWLGKWASLHVLQDADHLFTTHPGDTRYVAQLINLWAGRNGIPV
ncbi:MAG: alpha/beta fold hydrolase [Planctomycetota bacterium]|nr:alpha/beta fold hydrolase [Pirellulaceae bacterium]MEC7108590.1 alpha/beta fold hydrolase [Planctomycetota bacterium]